MQSKEQKNFISNSEPQSGYMTSESESHYKIDFPQPTESEISEAFEFYERFRNDFESRSPEFKFPEKFDFESHSREIEYPDSDFNPYDPHLEKCFQNFNREELSKGPTSNNSIQSQNLSKKNYKEKSDHCALLSTKESTSNKNQCYDEIRENHFFSSTPDQTIKVGGVLELDLDKVEKIITKEKQIKKFKERIELLREYPLKLRSTQSDCRLIKLNKFENTFKKRGNNDISQLGEIISSFSHNFQELMNRSDNKHNLEECNLYFLRFLKGWQKEKIFLIEIWDNEKERKKKEVSNFF